MTRTTYALQPLQQNEWTRGATMFSTVGRSEVPNFFPPDTAQLKKSDPDPTLIRNLKKIISNHNI